MLLRALAEKLEAAEAEMVEAVRQLETAVDTAIKLRKETETRQVLADALRDSESALAIAAAENRIKKYSDLAGSLRFMMSNNQLTMEQKLPK